MWEKGRQVNRIRLPDPSSSSAAAAAAVLVMHSSLCKHLRLAFTYLGPFFHWLFGDKCHSLSHLSSGSIQESGWKPTFFSFFPPPFLIYFQFWHWLAKFSFFFFLLLSRSMSKGWWGCTVARVATEVWSRGVGSMAILTEKKTWREARSG